MRRVFLKLVVATALGTTLPALAAEENGVTYGSGMNRFARATGSPGEPGLLKLLAEEFARRADAVGQGRHRAIAQTAASQEGRHGDGACTGAGRSGGEGRFGAGRYNDEAYARQYDH